MIAGCVMSVLSLESAIAKADEPGADIRPVPAAAVAEIYYRAEAAWNDRDERAGIAAESRRMVFQDTGAADAYLAWSLVALADGHKGGDRFRPANYLRGSVRAASQLADLALEQSPDAAPAHVHRALLHLVAGKPATAQRELEVAAGLAKAGFHAQLYAAVIEAERGRSGRAHALLSEAERFATHSHHYTMINRAHVRVAQSDGDHDLEEQLHLEMIEMNPSSAHAHGSYGDFLLRVRRTEEAIMRYEDAAAIERYPGAVRGLEKARLRLRLSPRKAKRPPVQRGLVSEPTRN